MGEYALLPLCVVTGLIIYGLYRLEEAIANFEAGKEYRHSLAVIAHKLSCDEDAPRQLVVAVNFLADNAFKQKALRHFSAIAKKAENKTNATELARKFKGDFGLHYGELALGACIDYAYLSLLADRTWGKKLRSLKSHHKDAKEVKRARTNFIPAIFEWVCSQAVMHPCEAVR